MGSNDTRITVSIPGLGSLSAQTALEAPAVRIAVLDPSLVPHARDFFLLFPLIRPLAVEVANRPDPHSNGTIPMVVVEAPPAAMQGPLQQFLSGLSPEACRHPLVVQAQAQLNAALAQASKLPVRLELPLPSGLQRSESALGSLAPGAHPEASARVGDPVAQLQQANAKGAGIRQPSAEVPARLATLDQPILLPTDKHGDPGARGVHAFYSEVRDALRKAIVEASPTVGSGEYGPASLMASPTAGLGAGAQTSPTKGAFDRLVSLLGGLDGAARELLDKRTMLREGAFQRVAFSSLLAAGLDGQQALSRLQEAFGGKLAISTDLLSKLAQQQQGVQQTAATKNGRLPEEMLLQQQRTDGAKPKPRKESLGYRRVERLLDDNEADDEDDTAPHSLNDEEPDTE